MRKTLNHAKSKAILKEIEPLHKKSFIPKYRKSDILFITGCTNRKLECQEEIPACDRFTGPSVKEFLSFFNNCESKKEKPRFDLYILSTGYGLIPASTEIQDYNISLNDANYELKYKMSEKLELGEDFQKLLNQGYKLIILSFSNEFIKVLNMTAPKEGYEVSSDTKVCYLKPNSTKSLRLHENFPLEIHISEKEIYQNGGKIAYQSHFWSEFFKNPTANTIFNRFPNEVKEQLK